MQANHSKPLLQSELRGMSIQPECPKAKRLQSAYIGAPTAFDKADKCLVMRSNENDPVYIAAWLTRRKAQKVLLDAMRAYRQHLDRHKCRSGLFTDVA